VLSEGRESRPENGFQLLSARASGAAVPLTISTAPQRPAAAIFLAVPISPVPDLGMHIDFCRFNWSRDIGGFSRGGS